MKKPQQNQYLKHYMLKDTDITVTHRLITSQNFPELHWHNYIEIVLILTGHGTHDLNGNRYEVSPGSVYMLRPTDFHQLIPDGEITLYNISISESALDVTTLERVSRYRSGIFANLNETEAETAATLVQLMLKEYNSKTIDLTILQKLLDCFIITVLKGLPELPKTVENDTDPISLALTYINMHFIDNPSLKSVAAVAHYSPSHFSSRFSEVVGVTFNEYLTELKIKYSKKLLVSTDLKISDIAFKSGFASESNFLRIFKSKVGCSPLNFRKNYRY